MRVVLRVEVEAVKFLKEEPHRLDALLKRCKTITETLATMRKYEPAHHQHTLYLYLLITSLLTLKRFQYYYKGSMSNITWRATLLCFDQFEEGFFFSIFTSAKEVTSLFACVSAKHYGFLCNREDRQALDHGRLIRCCCYR